MNELNREVQKVLLDGLQPGLRHAIDRMLSRGMSKRAVFLLVKAMAEKAAGGDPTKGVLTIAQVQAYLDACK